MSTKKNKTIALENSRNVNECTPTFKYKYSDIPPNMLKTAGERIPFNNIIMFEVTTDDAIMDAIDMECTNITALNFASSRNPGGGYINGSIAQEECLCRQYPALYNSLSAVKNTNLFW